MQGLAPVSLVVPARKIARKDKKGSRAGLDEEVCIGWSRSVMVSRRYGNSFALGQLRLHHYAQQVVIS